MGTRFKCENGHEWDLRITVASVKRVRAACDVDLYGALEGELIVTLANDPVLFADVLWSIVEPQAKLLGVSDEQFGEGLLGESLEHAVQAFIEGLRGFFGRPGQRAVLDAMARKTDQAMARAEQISMQRLEKINPSDLIDRAVAEIDRKRQNASSTEPPASAASVQTDSPSESSPPCSKPKSDPSGAEPPMSCTGSPRPSPAREAGRN